MRRDKRRKKSAVRKSFLKEEVVAPAQSSGRCTIMEESVRLVWITMPVRTAQ